MKKVLGINVNLSAVSWALADRAELECENTSLLRSGVRVPNLSPVEKRAFARGETAATNLQRKEFRNIRRMRNRYLLRRQRLIDALRREQILLPGELLSEHGPDTTHETWMLRAKAVSDMISLQEFSRVLLMMNKSRGCSKESVDDSSWIDELHATDLTYGQFTYRKVLSGESLAGHLHLREDSIAEFNRVWDNQSSFYPVLTPELKTEIRDKIIFYQRPGKSEKDSVLFCPYESWERKIDGRDGKSRLKRMGCRVAPKSSPMYQRMRIWEKLNNITLRNDETNAERSITMEEKNALAAELEFRDRMRSDEILAFLFPENTEKYSMNFDFIKGNVTFALLSEYVPKEMLSFDPFLPKEEYERQLSFRLWHLIYSVGDDENKEDLLVDKIYALTGLDDETSRKVAGIEFEDGFGGLSHKAIRKVLPFMMEGQRYVQAVVSAGYKYGKVTAGTLDRMPELSANHFRNPVIDKLFFQVIHIVNALLDEGEKPDAIRLSLDVPAKKYVRKEMQRLLRMVVYDSKAFFRHRDEQVEPDYLSDVKDALRFAAGSSMGSDEFERQAEDRLKEVLVSYRVQSRVATKNTNRIRVGGGRIIEQPCLTPRGQLHKEMLYSRREDLDGNVSFVIRKPAEGDDLQLGQKRLTVPSRVPAYPLRWKHDKEGCLILDSDGNPFPNDYVVYRNNHHIAVYEDFDGNLHEEVVTFKEALDRMLKGRPAIDRDYMKAAGWGFCFSMLINEMFVFPDESTGFEPDKLDLMDRANLPLISKHLFRVQKISRKDYSFVLHSKASVRTDLAMKNITWKRITSPNMMKGAVKVRLNHLGEIVEVFDAC